MEMLLAIAIAVIVLVIVNTSFFRSHANIESIRSQREVYQTVRIVMDRMIKDLTCTYIPSDGRQMSADDISLYRFIGVNDESNKTDKDSIFFTTTTDIGFSKVPGALCEVDYYLKETEGKQGVYTLMRREDPTPHFGVTKSGIEMEIAEDVLGMDVVYLDDTSQEVKEWNLGQRLTLPKQVKVTLTFEAGKESLKFTGVASLPLAGIRLSPGHGQGQP
jgi:hypothetical protein